MHAFRKWFLLQIIVVFVLTADCTGHLTLFSWDAAHLESLRNNILAYENFSQPLSASLLKLWEESNADLTTLAEGNFPSVHLKHDTVEGTFGDKSFYSSVVPYAFPCNNKPPGCIDYSGNRYSGVCSNDGLPWVICDGKVS